MSAIPERDDTNDGLTTMSIYPPQDGNDDSTDVQNSEEGGMIEGFVHRIFGLGEDPTGTTPAAALQNSDPAEVRRWSLGDHGTDTGINPEEIMAAAETTRGIDDDLAGVLQEAAAMVEGTNVRGFECPVCGLKHGHSDTKHDVRDAFNVTTEFADEMPFNPYCHCGVNWLAEVIDFIGATEQPMFTDEDQFAALLDHADGDDHELVTDIVHELDEAVNDPDVDPEIEQIIEVSSGLEPTDRLVDAVDAFYSRYSNIQRAASDAPIASETRNEIEEKRDMLVGYLNDGDDDVPDGELGSALGTRGYVDAIAVGELYELEVYPGTDVENGSLDDVKPGDEVIVTEEGTELGTPVAESIYLTE